MLLTNTHMLNFIAVQTTFFYEQIYVLRPDSG